MAELEENLLELYDEDISMISGISDFSCPKSSMCTSHSVGLVGEATLRKLCSGFFTLRTRKLFIDFYFV